jgi:hypothetical protein
MQVKLKNTSTVAALNTKLIAINAADGQQILPAFFSDNYISLMPSEERIVAVDLPGASKISPIKLKMYGWNVEESSLDVAP